MNEAPKKQTATYTQQKKKRKKIDDDNEVNVINFSLV